MTAYVPPPLNNRHIYAFILFDRANPYVWNEFVKFAFDMARKRKRLSARLIIERIRWDMPAQTNPIDQFRINNNFIAYYARKFELFFPGYTGRFETRSSPGTI
jgi:hypothetical protein